MWRTIQLPLPFCSVAYHFGGMGCNSRSPLDEETNATKPVGLRRAATKWTVSPPASPPEPTCWARRGEEGYLLATVNLDITHITCIRKERKLPGTLTKSQRTTGTNEQKESNPTPVPDPSDQPIPETSYFLLSHISTTQLIQRCLPSVAVPPASRSRFFFFICSTPRYPIPFRRALKECSDSFPLSAAIWCPGPPSLSSASHLPRLTSTLSLGASLSAENWK